MAAMQAWEDAQDAQRAAARAALEDRVRELRPGLSDEEVGRIARDGDTDALAETGSAAQRAAAQRGIVELRERTKDIRRLEESIVALHQLFIDMQIMVEAQADLLDGVEYDIAETKTNTAAALDDLVVARAHQKSAHKKICCIVVIVIAIVIATAIGLIIKFAPGWVQATKKKVEDSLGITNSTKPSPAPSPSPPKTRTVPIMQGGRREPANVTKLMIDKHILR